MASSGSWYSLTELCCDTWRQQKNSLEKKFTKYFHIELVRVCVCRAGEKIDLNLLVINSGSRAGISDAVSWQCRC